MEEIEASTIALSSVCFPRTLSRRKEMQGRSPVIDPFKDSWCHDHVAVQSVLPERPGHVEHFFR